MDGLPLHNLADTIRGGPLMFNPLRVHGVLCRSTVFSTTLCRILVFWSSVYLSNSLGPVFCLVNREPPGGSGRFLLNQLHQQRTAMVFQLFFVAVLIRILCVLNPCVLVFGSF